MFYVWLAYKAPTILRGWRWGAWILRSKINEYCCSLKIIFKIKLQNELFVQQIILLSFFGAKTHNSVYFMFCLMWNIYQKCFYASQSKIEEKKTTMMNLKLLNHSFFIAFINHKMKTLSWSIWFLSLFTEESRDGKFDLHIFIFSFCLFFLSFCLSFWTDWIVSIIVHIQTIQIAYWRVSVKSTKTTTNYLWIHLIYFSYLRVGPSNQRTTYKQRNTKPRLVDLALLYHHC